MKLNDIEIEFNSHLARVYDRGSINSGVQGCHKMINEFAGNAQVGSVFLRALMDKGAVTAAKSKSGQNF